MSPSPRPFEVSRDYLREHLDALVTSVFEDLESQFLVLPRGGNLVAYATFQDAYETLKNRTNAFRRFDLASVLQACRDNSLCFLVLRTMLGLTPPEWADVAASETGVAIGQGAARTIDQACRARGSHIADLSDNSLTRRRVEAMVFVAIEYLVRGAPGAEDTVHRLDKFDTAEGLVSLQHAAQQHVPYTVLLYERYLGRPFASHRDSVSELIGDVMESAIEQRLTHAKVTFRKTGRAERVPGFDQAPDFTIPDEVNPAVVIEAKLTGDDGTARDKVTRIIHLTEVRERRLRGGELGFQVVACIDGRGFGIRREDMRRLLVATEGKVFTLATLDSLVDHTDLARYLPG